MGRLEVGEQKRGARGSERASAEKAADVDAIIFDASEAHVGVIAEVDLEVAGERKMVRVDFESDPRGGSATAAGGEDASGSIGEGRGASVRLKSTAGGDEGVGETMIERVTAEAEGGRREFLDTRKAGTREPGDVVVERGVGEERIELEAVAGVRGESGDEFAADAVARVMAGFENRDVDAGATEGEAEAETGEAAADDFDGAGGHRSEENSAG